MKRDAKAAWKGSGKEGSGTISTHSGVIKDAKYTYKSRFESDPQTNPEELVAAAHAACFSMKLSFILGAAGFTPDQIDTNCDITFESGSVTKSELTVKASVPGITAEKFNECVEEAKNTCPISKLLNAEISATGSLN